MSKKKKSFKVGGKELGRFIKMRKSIMKNTRILKRKRKNGDDI